MSIIMVYWDWKANSSTLPTCKIYSINNITHGGGANFNGRVAKCESVNSLTVTGAQTLSCTLGLQAREHGNQSIMTCTRMFNTS